MLVDVTPSQEMVDEGVAREVVNKIQKLRKKVGLVGVRGRGEGGGRDEGGRGGGVWKKDRGSEEGRREGCGMDLVKLYF